MEKKGQYNSFEENACRFVENFDRFKDKRIVIYGVGQYTATLFCVIKDSFNVVGLLDGKTENIGRIFYGHKVLTLDEAQRIADIIIINTSEAYWNLIYSRLIDATVPVYFSNGEKAELKEFESILTKHEKTLEIDSIKKKIDEYDVVSFDIFETLLLRRLMDDSDLFRILDKLYSEKNRGSKQISEYRREALIKLKGLCYSIDDIYSKMHETHPEIDTDLAKSIELYIEQCVLFPRKDMIEVFDYALSSGKEVYLISDMYIGEKYMVNILKKNGIVIGEDRILISCDKNAEKRDGSLWRIYKENYVKNRIALHIGDNEKSDIEKAEEHGIEAIKIPSSSRMLEQIVSSSIFGMCDTVQESILLGCVKDILFNSPFDWKEKNDKFHMTSCIKMGKVIFAPIVLKFIIWIEAQKKKDEIKKIVFLGRDAYLIKRDFDFYETLNGMKNVNIYMYTSRKALSVLSESVEEVIKKQIDLEYNGSFKHFLKYRFNTIVDGGGDIMSQYVSLPQDKEKVISLLRPIIPQITEQTHKDRENYGRYVNGIGFDESYAIVDLFYKGTCQHAIEQFTGKKLQGYYFNADLSAENPNYRGNMKACFQDTETGNGSSIWKNHKILESMFTAPYGMTRGIDDYGNIMFFPFGENGNQTKWEVREQINDGILEFIYTYLELLKLIGLELTSDSISYKLVDEYFGKWFEGTVDFGETIKNAFWHEDFLITETTTALFE